MKVRVGPKSTDVIQTICVYGTEMVLWKVAISSNGTTLKTYLKNIKDVQADIIEKGVPTSQEQSAM